MNRMRIGTMLAAVILSTATTHAQEAKPLPQHIALAFFAGEWTFTGTYAGVKYGPGEAGAIGESCESLGGFFIVCRYHVRSPTLAYAGVGVLGYSQRDSVYTFESYESTGTVGSPLRGTQREGVWRLAPADGKTRVTWTQASKTSYRIQIETTADGKTWSTVMEGRYDKPR